MVPQPFDNQQHQQRQQDDGEATPPPSKRATLANAATQQQQQQQILLADQLCRLDSSSSSNSSSNSSNNPNYDTMDGCAQSNSEMDDVMNGSSEDEDISDHSDDTNNNDDHIQHASSSNTLLDDSIHSTAPFQQEQEQLQQEQLQQEQEQDVIEHVQDFELYGEGIYTGTVLLDSKAPHGNGRMEYHLSGNATTNANSTNDTSTNDYHVDVAIYDGDWKHGQWHGDGSITFSNGDSYFGRLEWNNRQGQGTYVWADGRTYEGSFAQNRRHGTGGTLSWPDGSSYSGDFHRGQRTGVGTYLFDCGHVYKGEWFNGKYNGHGVFKWNDGREYRGEWRNGLHHGQGAEYFADGTICFQGQWIDHTPIQRANSSANANTSTSSMANNDNNNRQCISMHGTRTVGGSFLLDHDGIQTSNTTGMIPPATLPPQFLRSQSDSMSHMPSHTRRSSSNDILTPRLPPQINYQQQYQQLPQRHHLQQQQQQQQHSGSYHRGGIPLPPASTSMATRRASSAAADSLFLLQSVSVGLPLEDEIPFRRELPMTNSSTRQYRTSTMNNNPTMPARYSHSHSHSHSQPISPRAAVPPFNNTAYHQNMHPSLSPSLGGANRGGDRLGFSPARSSISSPSRTIQGNDGSFHSIPNYGYLAGAASPPTTSNIYHSQYITSPRSPAPHPQLQRSQTATTSQSSMRPTAVISPASRSAVSSPSRPSLSTSRMGVGAHSVDIPVAGRSSIWLSQRFQPPAANSHVPPELRTMLTNSPQQQQQQQHTNSAAAMVQSAAAASETSNSKKKKSRIRPTRSRKSDASEAAPEKLKRASTLGRFFGRGRKHPE